MPTVEEVGEKIRASIREARVEGFSIKPFLMYGTVGDKRCCAVGSVVRDVHKVDAALYHEACERLSLNMEDVISIARGFDGKHSLTGDDTEWQALGVSLRKEVHDGTL